MSGAPSSPVREIVREAIDVRRLPWIRPLVSAYANDFSTVAPLFAGNPAEPAAWRETIARVTRAPHDCAAIARVLDRQLTRRGAPDEARRAAAQLADPRTVAILTGQQAGLFGGPLYTLLKAITALQLASRLRHEHGTPAVAVFWVDEEDHDWEEIRTANVLDDDLQLRQIALAAMPGAGDRSAALLTLDTGIDAAISLLAAVLPQGEFTADVLARLREHYRPGVGMGAAFAGWIESLLGRHGLVVFEAGDKAAKPLVADLFVQELSKPGRTAALSRDAGAEMARLGHTPQVEPAEDVVALFYLDDVGRHPIKWSHGAFVIEHETRATDALREEARTHPERFSPNVLLRPLVQDRLFPTVSYVGGPSELAYQAQLKSIYREFDVQVPMLFSRASATLLDAGATRFLAHHHVPLESLQPQDESALNRLLESQLPPALEERLDEMDREIGRRTDALKEEVVRLDPTLSGAADTTADRMRETLKTLQHKIIQATKRKDETLRRQFTHARALAFPDGDPQERALSIVYFLNRYGPGLCDRLLEILPLDGAKHYVLAP
jgi:bacillithiol biosynthesis cysteine-adding enzyme BshC